MDSGLSSAKILAFVVAILGLVVFLGAVNYVSWSPEIVEAQQCPQIKVSTDKSTYVFGETAIIRVEFVHLPPGCVETQEVHTHSIVVDVEGLTIGAWDTQGDSTKTIAWTPTSARTFNVRACSWRSGTTLETCASAAITVGSNIVTRTVEVTRLIVSTSSVFTLPPIDYGLVSVGVGIAIAGAAIGLAVGRRKSS